MADQRKTPQLRFAQFTDEWEERTIGDYLTISKTPGHTGSVAKKLTVKLWGKGVVEKKDKVKGSDNTQYYIRHTGQLMYGKLDFLHAAFGIVPEELDCYESTTDSPAFDLSDIDGQFLLNRIIQESFYFKYGTVANGTRKAKRIHEKSFLSMPIVTPKIDEQVKIGLLFSTLNSYITLHQHKYEKLLATKKTMLERMFPRKGTDRPEVRFGGFTEPWRRYQLGDIISQYSDPVLTPHNGYERLGIKSHGRGVFHTYVGEGEELSTAQMHKVAANKMIVNITFAWEHAVAVTKESDEGKLVSHRFPQFSISDSVLPDFLHYLILEDKFRYHLWLSSPGGAGRNRVLKIPEMLKYKLLLPDLGEQRRIATTLKTLDNLINLHEQEIEKLKNIKKALLEKMFI